MIVPRYKISHEGKASYVYGDHHRTLGAAQRMGAHVEHAGHYDSDRNEVVMTEPTSVQEGKTLSGAVVGAG